MVKRCTRCGKKLGFFNSKHKTEELGSSKPGVLCSKCFNTYSEWIKTYSERLKMRLLKLELKNYAQKYYEDKVRFAKTVDLFVGVMFIVLIGLAFWLWTLKWWIGFGVGVLTVILLIACLLGRKDMEEEEKNHEKEDLKKYPWLKLGKKPVGYVTQLKKKRQFDKGTIMKCIISLVIIIIIGLTVLTFWVLTHSYLICIGMIVIAILAIAYRLGKSVKEEKHKKSDALIDKWLRKKKKR